MRAGGYPCWLYDAAGGHLFKSEEEHKAYGGVLYESPADVPLPAQESAPVQESAVLVKDPPKKPKKP